MRRAGPRRQRRSGHRFSWAPSCLAGFRGAGDGRLGWAVAQAWVWGCREARRTWQPAGSPWWAEGHGPVGVPGTWRGSSSPAQGRGPHANQRSPIGCQPEPPGESERPWRGPRPKPVKPALPPHVLPAHSPASLCSTHVLPARHTPGCVLRSRDSQQGCQLSRVLLPCV